MTDGCMSERPQRRTRYAPFTVTTRSADSIIILFFEFNQNYKVNEISKVYDILSLPLMIFFFTLVAVPSRAITHALTFVGENLISKVHVSHFTAGGNFPCELISPLYDFSYTDQ